MNKIVINKKSTTNNNNKSVKNCKIVKKELDHDMTVTHDKMIGQ